MMMGQEVDMHDIAVGLPCHTDDGILVIAWVALITIDIIIIVILLLLLSLLLSRGLSSGGRCCSYQSASCLSVLYSIIGGCQTNIEQCQIILDRPKPCMMWSARWAIPVSWQKAMLAPRSRLWTDQHMQYGRRRLTQIMLVNTSEDLCVGNAGPADNLYAMLTPGRMHPGSW